jgi:hypothetical protein
MPTGLETSERVFPLRRCSVGLVVCAALSAPAAGVAAQTVPAAVPEEGVVGQAAIAAGNLASARERAMDDAFRQLCERAFTDLLGETGTGSPSPALASLRATWIARPRRLVRNYRVLEQGEVEGNFRVRVSAELDAAHMRREFDRVRGSGNRGVTPGVVPVVGAGSPEAPAALAPLLQAEGVHAQHQPGGATDEPALRALAARSGRGVVVVVSGRAASEGPVRGTSEQSVECQLGVRLVGADGSVRSPERSWTSRAFASSDDQARASCFGRASRDLIPALLPDLGLVAGGSGDLRAVLLDLDINEPAVISPVLRALRKIAGPTATEVRRVIVGRVEVHVRSRLAPPALLAALGRELASIATVSSTGQGVGDRLPAQVRLLAVTAPTPVPPVPDPGAPSSPAMGTQR